MAQVGNEVPTQEVEDPGGGRLSDLAYRRVLEALFGKKLPAGAFVSQSDLVRLTGVPVGPLRDALRVLEAEGILTILPRAGIQFVKPGFELTRSTYQFRSILECAAVRVYAETAKEDQIEQLIADHERAMEGIRREGRTPELHDRMESLEDALHGSIIGALNNPLIESSYKRVWNYLRLLRLDRNLTAPPVLRSLGEHVQILLACRSRDADQAVVALQAHFSGALHRNLGLF